MKKAILLLAGVLLVAQPAFAGLGSGPMSDAARHASAQKNWRLAQEDKHGCKPFAKANHCKARWDPRSKSCVCNG